MTERLTRDRIIDVLRALPPNATLDEAIEKLVFLSNIERGIGELEAAKACHTRKSEGVLACH